MNKIRKIMSSQAGFTLIELLIVIVILGVLSAIIIPRMTNLTNDARISSGKTSLRSIYNGLEMYAAKNTTYPDPITDVSDYIENFSTLDNFLGDWTTTGTSFYVPGNAGTTNTVLTIYNGNASPSTLTLNGLGNIN